MNLSKAPDLVNLQTLSLSFVSTTTASFTVHDIPTLPELSNLSSLHLTLSGDKRPLGFSSFSRLFLGLNRSGLKRLSLLNLIISASQLTIILDECPNLEELYITISSRKALRDCSKLENDRLKVFHANAPPDDGPTSDDLTELARRMPSLDQIGSGTKVYEVWRSLGDKEEKVVELSRWGRITVPAYFQIWRG